MTTGWIKLTAQQATDIANLSASNPGNNFITPRLDALGNKWLSAGGLNEPLFAHYAPVLATLSVTQQEEPIWPEETQL
jgi:hypothetical protein